MILLLAYAIAFIYGISLMDYLAQKKADRDLFKQLEADMNRVFGRIEPPISLAMAQHEMEMEAINGLMVEDDPDLNDPYRQD